MLREQKQEPPTLAFLQGTVGEGCGYAEGPSRARERTAANVWEHDASASGKVEGLPKPDTFFFFSLLQACNQLPTSSAAHK